MHGQAGRGQMSVLRAGQQHAPVSRSPVVCRETDLSYSSIADNDGLDTLHLGSELRGRAAASESYSSQLDPLLIAWLYRLSVDLQSEKGKGSAGVQLISAWFPLQEKAAA